MGVSRCDYVMLAVRTNLKMVIDLSGQDLTALDPYIDNTYAERVSSHKGVTVVIDGMNGEYVFMGKVLAKGIEGSAGLRPLEVVQDVKKKRLVERIVRKQFGIRGKAGYYVFTHWH